MIAIKLFDNRMVERPRKGGVYAFIYISEITNVTALFRTGQLKIEINLKPGSGSKQGPGTTIKTVSDH